MIISDCEGSPATTETMSYHGGSDTFGLDGVDGDPVPHSDLRDSEGGEEDMKDYLAGEWVFHTEPPEADPMEWVCDCVKEYVADWEEVYAAHWSMECGLGRLFGEDVRQAHRDAQAANA